MPNGSKIFGRRDIAGPVLTDEQERRRQREVAQQHTRAIEEPFFGEGDVGVPGMGKIAGFGLGMARLAGRQASRAAAILVPGAIREAAEAGMERLLPQGSRVFDFAVQHAGREAGRVAVALDPAMRKGQVVMFALSPELRGTREGLSVARDVFEELRRRVPEASIDFERITGTRGARGIFGGRFPAQPTP